MNEPSPAPQPSEGDLEHLFPVVLPLEALDAGWPGPIVRIGDLPFAATWAVLGDGNVRVYVDHDQAAHWNSLGIDWKAKAFANLKDLSRRHPASHAKSDEAGTPFLLIMLNKDAIGPSRLLVPNLFDELLGADYLVAIPEATCAVAYRRSGTAEQTGEAEALVRGLFERGTEPLSPVTFDPARFWCLAPGSA